MHPILKRRSRLVLYLAVWIVFGLLLTVVFIFGGRAPPLWSLQFAVPMAMLLGMISLSFWYLAQSMPPGDTPIMRMVVMWVSVGLASLLGWLAIGYVWAQYLLPDDTDIRDDAAGILGLMIFAGAIGISLAVLGHYLAGAFERSRNAERRALELQVLAREAELKSLRAQLDPHFLFNSLNSVAALIGNDTAAARQMCFLMAQFFRKSLTLGREQSIPLSEEVGLAQTFLSIERVRFGERLRSNFDIAHDVRDVVRTAVVPAAAGRECSPSRSRALARRRGSLCHGASPRELRGAGGREPVRSGPAAVARYRGRFGERALAGGDSVRSSRQRGRKCHRREIQSVDPAALRGCHRRAARYCMRGSQRACADSR